MAKSKIGSRQSYSNARLFGFSLLLAMSIWLIAKQGEQDTDNITVPVVVRGHPAHLEIASVPPEITVNMQFPRALKGEIIPNNFEILPDVAQLNPMRFAGRGKPGSAAYTLKTADLVVTNPKLPRDIINIQRFVPGVVDLQARLLGRTARVKPTLRGEPSADYMVTRALSSIPEVFLAGPTDAIDALIDAKSGRVEIPTEPVNIAGLSASVVQRVTLAVPTGMVALMPEENVQVGELEVSVSIDPVRVVQDFPGIPVDIPVLANVRVEVVPPSVTVRVEGPKPLLDDIFITPSEAEEHFSFLLDLDFGVEEAGREYNEVPLEVRLVGRFAQAGEGVFAVKEILPPRVKVRFLAPAEN